MAEFKNPSQGGGQDNRSFLVMMVVMFGVIFGLAAWRAKHNPPTQEPSPPAARQAADQPAAAPPASAATAPLGSAPAAVAAKAVPPAVTVQAAAKTSTVVENELYRITFSNRGGEVTSWILKKYKDDEGHPLDLVHDGASKQFGYPLSLYTYDPALTKGLANVLYVPSATGTLEAPATLSFNYAYGNIQVHKTFTFGADYVIHADAVVLRDGAPVRALLAWPAGLGDMETLQTYASATIDTSTNGKDSHFDVKKTIGGATRSGPFAFAGVSDQYFGALFLPDHPDDTTMVTLHNQIDVKNLPHGAGRAFSLPGSGKSASSVVPILGAAVGSLSGHDQESLFVGPKAIGVLKSIHTADGNNLEPVLDFGFFGPIGKVLFLGLRWVHDHVASNWGWALVIFTVFINVLMLPLRVMGMKSAVKMQRIQPQIDAIKARYKNPKPTDPKMGEMNAEVMALQKANGVNMFGGCLPALIPMPLLFAFFTMMTTVVELRQAHWYWLPDLAGADPYHILPIFMIISSFLVQFYTPSPGVDPQQQKMMAFFMPAFSGYLCWNYASGLALYWNVGNIIMIITQGVLNRTSMGREMREIATKRAARKAGLKASAANVGGSRLGGAKLSPAKTIQGKR